MSAPASVLADRGAELSGAAVRRLTRRATAARADTTAAARLAEVWSSLVSGAIGVAVVAGAVASVRERVTLAGAPVTATVLPASVTAAVAAVLALAGLAVALARLGPVSSTPAAAAWWLPLPAGRRDLLRGELARVTAAVVGVAAVAALPLALTLTDAPSAGGVAAALAATAGTAAALVGAVARAQTRGGPGRAAPLAGAGAVAVAGAAVAGATALAATGGGDLPALPGVPAGWAAVPVAAAVLLLAGAVAGLDRLGAGQLRALGATAQYAAVSAVSLDARELGRALAARDRREPRRGRRFPRVAGAWQAVVAADRTALARSPWHLGQAAVAVAVPVLVARTDGLGALPPAVWVACVAGWALAAVAAGHPARQAQAVPALDRLLPLSAAGVTAARVVVPLALLVAVTTLTGLLLGVGSGAPALWTALCAATAPAWAAAALRGAFRPEVDWSGPVVSTPMGALPTGVGATLVQGLDAGLVGSLPLAAALVSGGPTPLLVAVQLGWSVLLGAGVLTLVARRRGGPG
ncbi:hypothetical protein SAMN05660690_4293 [Geodermatophilus telluris]|uniref:ABC-2 type transport system permease protein n=1 Tax=Geodermatophilus telluris TaxID=1190417 RepID=A0A1G6V0F7_9ACTN|nr:DUF6297 family protein [Geodermatophilus telluris]SDD47089.1 hypothetical protein SAMN05660690_4293 [Geodermatophilus telluris]